TPAEGTSTFALGALSTLAVGQQFDSTTDGAVLTLTAVNASLGTVSFTVSHQYLDDNPTNTVADLYRSTVAVEDDDLGRDVTQVVSTVANVSPQLVNLQITDTDENGVATLTGTIIDPGTLDTFKLTIDWGDGNVETHDLPAGTTEFEIDHRFLDDDP